MLFNIVLGLAGLAACYRAAAYPTIGGVAGLSLGNTTGDVVTIIAAAALALVSLL